MVFMYALITSLLLPFSKSGRGLPLPAFKKTPNNTFTETKLNIAIYWIYIILQDFKVGEIFTKSSATADCYAENYGQCRRLLWPSHALHLHIQVLSGRCIFQAHKKNVGLVGRRIGFLQIFTVAFLLFLAPAGGSNLAGPIF